LGIIGKKSPLIDKNSKSIIFTKKKAMLTKEKVNRTINNLPDKFTIDELIDKLIFMEKIEEGLQQSKEGKVVSNEDLKVIIDKWSK
jgi:Zn-dependent alcohol dehydrogenase